MSATKLAGVCHFTRVYYVLSITSRLKKAISHVQPLYNFVSKKKHSTTKVSYYLMVEEHRSVGVKKKRGATRRLSFVRARVKIMSKLKIFFFSNPMFGQKIKKCPQLIFFQSQFTRHY
jgi:hypothetical protein